MNSSLSESGARSDPTVVEKSAGTIRVVIADDERMARRKLARLLKLERDVEIVAECVGGQAAVAALKSHDVDVAFIDVQMPDLDGFAVIDAVGPEKLPYVVFVTAFDRYALQAFDVDATDYLLKPYDAARFQKAMSRARERVITATGRRTDYTGPVDATESDTAVAGSSSARQPLERIPVPVKGGIRIVRTTDVEWFETDGNYLRLHTSESKFLVRKTASELEATLDPRRFVRIHRRYIVNLDRVFEVQPWFSGDAVVIMQSGSRLRLSRTHREAFYSLFSGSK
ncbi:MAG TPA: LytTR family DNA-binding domain-containing protein [Gemmatimonadaceae bacterium]|nr:LytTR family DNA-binding domain-containing protein [Gemmatimonadaceae bacterium]